MVFSTLFGFPLETGYAQNTGEETPKDTPSTSSAQVDVSPYFETPDGITAMEAFKDRRYEEAADLFHILAREPIPPEIELPSRYLEAVSTHYSGDFKKAVALFSKLEKSYPLLRHYHQFFQGEGYKRMGENQKALKMYKR